MCDLSQNCSLAVVVIEFDECGMTGIYAYVILFFRSMR